jgi:hypothetical protein
MLNVIFHIYIYIHIYIHTPPMLNDLTSVVSEYLTSVTYSSCANSITAKVITRGEMQQTDLDGLLNNVEQPNMM